MSDIREKAEIMLNRPETFQSTSQCIEIIRDLLAENKNLTDAMVTRKEAFQLGREEAANEWRTAHNECRAENERLTERIENSVDPGFHMMMNQNKVNCNQFKSEISKLKAENERLEKEKDNKQKTIDRQTMRTSEWQARIDEFEKQIDCGSDDTGCDLYEQSGVVCYRHLHYYYDLLQESTDLRIAEAIRLTAEGCITTLEETPHRCNQEFEDFIECYEKESIEAIRAKYLKEIV